MAKKQWTDLATWQQALIVIWGIVEIGLLVAGLVDIVPRSPERINGSKRGWTAALFINFFGPIAYFVFGRKR